MNPDAKVCEQCGDEFTRTGGKKGIGPAVFAKRRYCDRECAKAARRHAPPPTSEPPSVGIWRPAGFSATPNLGGGR